MPLTCNVNGLLEGIIFFFVDYVYSDFICCRNKHGSHEEHKTSNQSRFGDVSRVNLFCFVILASTMGAKVKCTLVTLGDVGFSLQLRVKKLVAWYLNRNETKSLV